MKKNNLQKLIIGSAQFGMNYGINNSGSKIKLNEIKKIFNILAINNLNKFDTASSYGMSEKIIGKFLNKKHEINTKIQFSKNTKKNHIGHELKKSQFYLKKRYIHSVLIHSISNNVIENKKKIDFLNDMKRKKIIQKVGVSIYSIDELKYINDLKKIDVIQAPFNIFDQRILNLRFLKTLKKFNIELHVRSIFLQGLLLRDRGNLPEYFVKWSKLFDKWHKFLKVNNLRAIEACLNFAFSFPMINKVIVGIDDTCQLMEIIDFLKKKNSKILFPDLQSKDENLILPFNWKIN